MRHPLWMKIYQMFSCSPTIPERRTIVSSGTWMTLCFMDLLKSGVSRSSLSRRSMILVQWTGGTLTLLSWRHRLTCLRYLIFTCSLPDNRLTRRRAFSRNFNLGADFLAEMDGNGLSVFSGLRTEESMLEVNAPSIKLSISELQGLIVKETLGLVDGPRTSAGLISRCSVEPMSTFPVSFFCSSVSKSPSGAFNTGLDGQTIAGAAALRSADESARLDTLVTDGGGGWKRRREAYRSLSLEWNFAANSVAPRRDTVVCWRTMNVNHRG
ncbi:hypothetical protein Egran_06135 [Elaphomyces granulatus]|uniref:Uncharacterized protein n=1 Tax=Elaphomyces granulatus TaxID=519963 RepID=A0A232LQ17_9EURO|nr:hypothetical protein Egran_06135 [Elaphomyces granulatus]